LNTPNEGHYLFDKCSDILHHSTSKFKRRCFKQISANFFNYIVIDETHRAGTPNHQKILNHFKPEFLLGMTATPERTDGYDIFKEFEYNIAYEIRLHRALEERMLR
jgi:superfamily II DNA or RNA helicase